MELRPIGLFVALLAACGGAPGEEGPPRPVDLSADSAPDVLLVIADGVRTESLTAERLAILAPELAALADRAGSAPIDRGNDRLTPLVATLLCGDAGHGLVSARELGYHRLAVELPPAVADARAVGWSPMAAVAAPQLDGPLNGLDRGFDRWETVGTGSPRRTAPPAEVAARASAAIAEAVARAAPVLAVVQLSAPPVGEAGLPPVRDGEVLAAPFRSRETVIDNELGVQGAADLIALAAAGDLAAVQDVVGRRRGSRSGRALDEALADLWLGEVDAAVERLRSALAVRGEPRVVVVFPNTKSGEAGKWTGEGRVLGTAGWEQPAARVADLLPRLVRELGGSAAASLPAAQGRLETDVATSFLGGRFELLSIQLGAGHDWRVDVRAADEDAISAASHLLEDTALSLDVRRGDRFSAELRGPTVLTLAGPRRGVPLRVEVTRDGEPVPEADVLVCGRPLPTLPIPRLVAARGAPLPIPEDGAPEPDLPPVRLVERGGGRLALEGAIEGFDGATLAAWPPDPDGALPTPDADGLVRAGANRSLAVALPFGDGFLATADLALGDRFAQGEALVLVLPGYDDLELERRFVSGRPDLAPLRDQVHLWRPGAPFPPGPPIAPAERRFLAQLADGE